MSASEIEDFLKGLEFFSGLDAQAISFLADCATWTRVEAGTIVFQHGEAAQRFFVIRRGRIIVEIPAIEGPSIRVQSLGPGEVLGWSWLLPPYEWSFQARAEEDAELLELDGERVRKRCEAEPSFGYDIIKRFSTLMSTRLEAARRKMMDDWCPPGFA